MVQLELLGAVAMTLTSVIVSGGMPRRAAVCAACKGPGPPKVLAMLAAAAAGPAFRMSRRFILIPFCSCRYLHLEASTAIAKRRTFPPIRNSRGETIFDTAP